MQEQLSHESGQAKIRIVLADDQPLLRYGFKLVLEGEENFEIVGEASNGAEALDLVASRRPDVVLMDVRMPVMDGIESTRQICERYPEVSVIILTTFDLDEYAFSGLQAGASAFLLKDVDPQELIRAVSVVASGEAVVAPRVTARLLDQFVRQGHVVTSGTAENLEDLTPREHEVLLLIAEGYSNGEIAQNLYVSEATVKTHVGRILSKIGLRDRVHAVIFAYNNGLVRPGEGREF